ncbi:ATP-binding protein [Vallitalea sp.]|jgi:lon-related putative ATP-dependent protease|uniref:ATP-binding protein n=1 Tax=Vallitalea sp. TaxID=1882829 RepID=UPI002600DC57|nr:ATP-binding protein [Vallitalea sp.]MCT4688646.1 AAA family ATPase [Vallitalea sp.]
MKECYELSHEDLDLKSVVLEQSDNVEDEEDIFVGNGRVREILDFGLNLNGSGYNIYLSAEEGLNTVEFLKKFLKEKSKKNNPPDDWCYVYNFKNEDKPRVLRLKCGKGKKFKKTIENCVKDVILQSNIKLNSSEFKKVETCLKDEFLSKGETKLEELKDDAKKFGFSTNITDKGIFFIPIVDGKKISEEKYDDLTVEEQEIILENLNIMENKSEDIMKQVKRLKKISEAKVTKLHNKILKIIIDDIFEKIETDFECNKKVMGYIKELKEHLFKNIRNILSETDGHEILNSLLNDDEDDNLEKYRVNLFIDNSNVKTSPIIYCDNPSYYEMFGKIEYENELGVYTTNYTMIKKGILHNANSGYLIINAENILNTALTWGTLKKVLINKKLIFENIREQLGTLPIKTIKPEPIPMDLKVILIGNERIYRLLYAYDSEFKELFKLHVQLNTEVEKNKKIIRKYYHYFDDVCDKKKLRMLTKDGKNELLKYASYIAEDRNKLTTKFSVLMDLIEEADLYAAHSQMNVINSNTIKKAVNNKNNRSTLLKKNIQDLYDKDKIIIDYSEKKVGQINGVALSDYSENTIARIIRITAVTYMGKLGVINIEKENKLSGNVFDKSIGILSGYIGNKYSQDFPLMLNCQLCFEQVYNIIDGDSASCAELYAILSSLSEIPFDQSIVVTGSVDQFGNVQPVGGVTHKIRGCYELYKTKGLTGNQGIIVPKQNVDEIIMDDDILDDIKEGKFHIYAIDNIEQGIEIFTDVSMNEIDKAIENKLKSYYKKLDLKNFE